MMDIDDIYERILDYIEEEKYELAIRYCNRILRVKKDESTALLYKGECLKELGEYEKSLESYYRALEIDHGNVDVETYEEIAFVLLNLEMYEEAIEFYDKIIDESDDDREAIFYKGLAYEKLEKYDQASQQYDLLIKMNNTIFLPYQRKGIIYYNLEEYEKSLEYLNKALKHFPKKLDKDDEKQLELIYRNKIETLEKIK